MCFFWAWLLFPCVFVSIFLYLLHCALFFWPRGCPFTPESLAFAAGASKLRHAGAKHVQEKKKDTTESGKGKKAPGPITTQRKQRAIFQWFLQLCCLWAVCLVSLWPSPPHLPSQRENKLKCPDAQSFISPLFSHFLFFLHEVAENTVYFRFLIYVLSYFF